MLKTFFNDILTDADSARLAIKVNMLALERLSDELKKDHDLLLYTLALYGYDKLYKGETVLTYFDSQFRDDEKIMLTAIRQHPMAIMYASDRLKDNDMIGSVAVGQYFMRYMHLESAVPLEYLSPRLRENEKIIRTALEYYPDSLRCLSETFQNKYPDLVLQVIEKNPYLLQYVSKDIQKKYSTNVMALIENELSLVRFLCQDLQNQHPSIVLKAIHQNPYLLAYVNENFQEKYQQAVLNIVKLYPKFATHVTGKIPKEKILNAILEGFHAQYTATMADIYKLKENPDFKNHSETIDHLVNSLSKLELEFLKKFDYSALIKLKSECEKLFRDTEKKFDDHVFLILYKSIANTVMRLLNFMIKIFTHDSNQQFSLFTSTGKVWKNNPLKESLLNQLDSVDLYLKKHEPTAKPS